MVTLFLHFLLSTDIGLLDSFWAKADDTLNNIIQTRWENRNGNLQLCSWAPSFKVTKINCDIGMHVTKINCDIGMHEILLSQTFAKLFSALPLFC